MTTDEFCESMKELDISETLFGRIKSFLQHGDLVKFAKWVPSTERMIADFDEAHGMVEEIMQVELNKITILLQEQQKEAAGGGGTDV